MEAPYTPIPCSFHDQLLHYATRRELLSIRILNESMEVEIQATILDVFTRSGAEFMQLDNGQEYRLDQLLSVNGMDVQDATCAI
jgi:hypothetical protein